MTPKEILKVDAQRNHGGIDPRQLIGFINKEIKSGAALIQQGDTLMLFKTAENKRAEFHTFNAGNAADLAKNVDKCFEVLKKLGYTGAYTDYENPLISKLFMSYGPPKYEVTITDNEDEGFHVEVTL